MIYFDLECLLVERELVLDQGSGQIGSPSTGANPP